MKVKIKKLNPLAVIPKYQTPGASAFDLHVIEDAEIYAGQTHILKTGLAFEIPFGYELQVVPRSGISAKTKLRIANSPGTVDCDYRGEVGIIVDNIDPNEPYFITAGDRIAQGKIVPVVQVELEEVEELSSTERGEGGFGSTGTK